MASEIPEIVYAFGSISSIGVGAMIWDNFSIFRANCAIACVYAFGPQLNAFLTVGILLKYSRRNLLQFE